MGSTAAAAAVADADRENHTKTQHFLNPLATTTITTPQYSAHPDQPLVPAKVNPFNQTASNHSNQQQQQHFQNMVKSQQAANTMGKQKINRSTPNGEESPSRQLLPILVCLITFATVLSVLIIYMDTTEIRHQQFRLNMSRDYELQGISQDNPGLISYVREVHLRKYANTPYFAQPEEGEEQEQEDQHLEPKKKNSDDWDFRGRRELTPKMAQFVVEDLLAGKHRGVFVQSMTGANDALMTAQWLIGGAAWTGVIIEPEPRKYFNYRKHYGHRGVDAVHACVSPNEYPKEVTLRAEEEEENEVKINSVLGGGGGTEEDEDTEAWFHSRVKCFPLYTILLATNRTKVDLLSLGCHGKHLQVSEIVFGNGCFDGARINIRGRIDKFGN